MFTIIIRTIGVGQRSMSMMTKWKCDGSFCIGQGNGGFSFKSFPHELGLLSIFMREALY